MSSFRKSMLRRTTFAPVQIVVEDVDEADDSSVPENYANKSTAYKSTDFLPKMSFGTDVFVRDHQIMSKRQRLSDPNHLSPPGQECLSPRKISGSLRKVTIDFKPNLISTTRWISGQQPSTTGQTVKFVKEEKDTDDVNKINMKDSDNYFTQNQKDGSDKWAVKTNAEIKSVESVEPPLILSSSNNDEKSTFTTKPVPILRRQSKSAPAILRKVTFFDTASGNDNSPMSSMQSLCGGADSRKLLFARQTLFSKIRQRNTPSLLLSRSMTNLETYRKQHTLASRSQSMPVLNVESNFAIPNTKSNTGHTYRDEADFANDRRRHNVLKFHNYLTSRGVSNR